MKFLCSNLLRRSSNCRRYKYPRTFLVEDCLQCSRKGQFRAYVVCKSAGGAYFIETINVEASCGTSINSNPQTDAQTWRVRLNVRVNKMPSRRELANAVRALSMDAVQAAKSGHPGMPMGMADIAQVLWCDVLRHDPADPTWANRDRFVLSNGHGSMLLYSVLHLSGYGVSIDDLKAFRQLGSATPGHPEVGYTPGVETTTGRLARVSPTVSGWLSPNPCWRPGLTARTTRSSTTIPMSSWVMAALWKASLTRRRLSLAPWDWEN